MTSPAVGVDASAPYTPGDGIGFAGIALQALDTGRVLLLQRSLADPEDPNAGLWEFPGGGLDDGEDPKAGALREFSEEVGVPVPEDSEEGASWDLPPDAPKYRLYLMTIPNESAIDTTSNEVQNPDDPRGLDPESTAFWDPSHIQGDHIRPEVQDAMKTVGDTLTTPDTKVAAAPPVPPAPPAPPSADAAAPTGDATPVTDTQKVVDLLEQVEAAMAEPNADPSAVSDLITNALAILDPKEDTADESDALIASAAPVAPPDEWFEPFDLDGPTPLTVTADGRVFGHLADWNSCHRSGQYGGKCVRPPSDPTAPYFQLGEVITASGAVVRVGTVTVGGGHADPRLGLVAAIEHYDDVSAQAAVVVVREDEYGIGLFGSVVADAAPSLVASLRRSPLSGDWRKEKGKWRLVKAHAVNSPGFPITRGLVASGGDAEEGATAFFTMGRVEPKEPMADLRGAAQRLARSAGLDLDSLVASARAAMADIDCGCDDEEESITASVMGSTDLPVADYGMSWDGGAATARVFDHFTVSGKVDVPSVSKAFLWYDDSAPADEKGSYYLPFADIVDGELKIVPVGVQACAGGHGVGQLKAGATDADLRAIKGKISKLYSVIQTKYPQSPEDPFAAPKTP